MSRPQDQRRFAPILGRTPHVPQTFLIVLILLAAFALRAAAIERTPPGLSHDEAYNGIAALEVLGGQFRIFYEINKGIEPLIIWLEGLSFYLLGVGPVQLRLVSIFAGMLTVALIYPLAARLFNRQIALLAMAGVAISFWAVFVSRLALRAVLLPPLLLLTLYLFWRALFSPSKASLLFFALSGMAAGLTMYTYLSSRFVPFVLLTLLVYRLIRRKINRYQWWSLLLFAVIAGVIFWPLADYFIEHAASFTHRSSQVTTIPYALNGDFGPMLRNTGRTLAMFNLTGDTTDRYNLSGRPVFDWLNGALFLVGLGVVVWRFVRTPGRAETPLLLLGTAFFMLLPDFITDDSPHFLRTIGTLPVVYIFWAVGVDAAARQINDWLARRRLSLPAHLSTALVLVLVALMAGQTVVDYFFRWHTATEARKIYGADMAEVARYLKTSDSHDLPAISAEYYRDLDRFRLKLYFGGEPPFAIWFDGRQSLAFPPPETGLSPRYIFPKSAKAPDIWTSMLRKVPADSGAEFSLYRLPAQPEGHLKNLQPVGVTINNDVVLIGYRLLDRVVTGRQFRVLLAWQALKTLPPGTDYTFLVQMRDSRGHLWQQTDGNGFDPADWQPGLVGLQLLTFNLPGDLAPLTYRLSVQVVNRHTGQPLPTTAGRTVISLGAVAAQLAATPRPVNSDLIPNFIEAPVQNSATGLALRGYHLDVGDDSQAELTLHWQVIRQPAQQYRLQFKLRNGAGAVVQRWPLTEPLGGEWPTQNWPAGYWVQDKLYLPLDPALSPGPFTLSGQWLDPSGRPVSPEFDLGSL